MIKNFTSHTEGVKTIVELSNKLIATGSSDQTILIWNITTNQILRNLTSHNGTINSIIQLSNGNLASFSSAERKIKVWN